MQIKAGEKRNKPVSSNLHAWNRNGTRARCISDEIEGKESAGRLYTHTHTHTHTDAGTAAARA